MTDFNIHDNGQMWKLNASNAIAEKHSGIMKQVERNLENFINKHYKLLFHNNIIEDYLDIRDTLLIQITRQILEDKKTQQKYAHGLFKLMFQYQVEPDLRLTLNEINTGYIPCEVGGPIKYKCGCSALHYHNPREHNTNIITRVHYCKCHHKVKHIEAKLSSTLVAVKHELESITHPLNRINRITENEHYTTYKLKLNVNTIPILTA